MNDTQNEMKKESMKINLFFNIIGFIGGLTFSILAIVFSNIIVHNKSLDMSYHIIYIILICIAFDFLVLQVSIGIIQGMLIKKLRKGLELKPNVDPLAGFIRLIINEDIAISNILLDY